MSKFLDRAKELRARTDVHYSCSQSVLLPFAEAKGISDELATDFCINFSGGMRVAGTCGAITGGLMALGLYKVNDPSDVASFIREVKSNHDGNTECKDLLKSAREQGIEKKPHCDAMVFECVVLVEKMLRERGLL